MRSFQSLIFLLLTTLSLSAPSHESDREIQLKAANDELTKRVAELLDENAKLRAHSAKIQQQIREAPAGKPVAISTGCITPSHDAFYDDFILNTAWGDRNALVLAILEKSGKECSKDDLEFISNRLMREMYKHNSRLNELLRFYKSKL